MNRTDIREVLIKYKTLAIVGVSRDPSKDSHRVAEYLQTHGFQIVPVNPFVEEVLGQRCYKSLLDMPVDVQKTIEVVDVFRPSEEVLAIVEQVIQLKTLHGVPYVVWMQLGITNQQAAELARSVDLRVIMDKCMMQEHRRLFSFNKH